MVVIGRRVGSRSLRCSQIAYLIVVRICVDIRLILNILRGGVSVKSQRYLVHRLLNISICKGRSVHFRYKDWQTRPGLNAKPDDAAKPENIYAETPS